MCLQCFFNVFFCTLRIRQYPNAHETHWKKIGDTLKHIECVFKAHWRHIITHWNTLQSGTFLCSCATITTMCSNVFQCAKNTLKKHWRHIETHWRKIHWKTHWKALEHIITHCTLQHIGDSAAFSNVPPMCPVLNVQEAHWKKIGGTLTHISMGVNVFIISSN